MMRTNIYIGLALGGGIGSVLRYTLSSLLQSEGDFPYGTLTVNLLGCLLLSFFYQFFAKKMPHHSVLQKAITTGGLGSFTTFSAFSTESFQLFQTNPLSGVSYLIVTIIGGLLMTYIGFKWGGKLS